MQQPGEIMDALINKKKEKKKYTRKDDIYIYIYVYIEQWAESTEKAQE